MIVILAVVIFILWKYTHVLDGLKAKIKGQEEKWKKNAAEAAQREKEKKEQEIKEAKEKKARELEEKIANCEHDYQPAISNRWKDDLFREIDAEGYSIEQCTKCGNRIKGDFVTKINCHPIEDSLSTDVFYEYRNEFLNAGKYTVRFEEIHYLIANKNWPKLNVGKGEIFVYIKLCLEDKVEKTDDYPVGSKLVKCLEFRDMNGNPISDDTSLTTAFVDIKSSFSIAQEKYGCSASSYTKLDYERSMECIKESINSRTVLLRIPDQECELDIFAYFSDSQEGK